jgi:hypothetical protein
MTAVGYASTTGDPRKVDVAGDTMTGDLVLPDSTPDTDRSATSKAYVLAQVAGAGTGVASDTVVEATEFGQEPSAGVSAAYARGDHTHGTPAAPAGGGSTIRTASVRITDDNLSGLPAAASWTIVQTSGGTQLKASIGAVAGDRIRVCANFLYVGSHFLDWVLLDSEGAIALYAGSGTSSPLGEGNPSLYPALTLSKDSNPEMFTVAAEHIDGDGNVTIALAHQGAAGSPLDANKVYAHTTYPWRLRLENIGGEPS